MGEQKKKSLRNLPVSSGFGAGKMSQFGGRKNKASAHPHIHALTRGACEHVILHGKSDLAGVTEVTGLEMGLLPWIICVGPV